MPHELMNVTATSPALPARRSTEYVEWLIVELGRLAAYLGKQDALDSEGYRASEMACDLAWTRPAVMQRALARYRQESAFFPTTKELVDLYQVEARKMRDAEATEQRRQEDEAMRRLRSEHPERFISGPQFLAEHVNELRQAGTLENLRRQVVPQPKITIPEPTVNECPHCGNSIPFRVTDLRGLSAADLRSMADRKEARAAEIEAARQKASVAQPTAQKKRTRRRSAA